MRLFLHKLIHWEYWPFQLLYLPVYFQWAWYSLRARSLFFFNASNPSFRNGGFFMESKKQIYDLIPKQYYPNTELIAACSSLKVMTQRIAGAGICFPLIAKPDVGLRGSAVRKINDEADLLAYAGKGDFNFLVQDCIPYLNEVGIFYVRYPTEPKGRITGIVSKEFLSVTGDGVTPVRNLLRRDPRHEMQLKRLQRELGAKLDEVPEAGETRRLVPFGNHVRGAKFIDASDWNSPQLTELIDGICSQIPGFYFGRLDLMYRDWPSLQDGKHFSIVELNGAASEPTQIYDPSHSLFFAWKELLRHVRHMYRISRINHRNGAPYLNFRAGMREYFDHVEHNRKIVGF